MIAKHIFTGFFYGLILMSALMRMQIMAQKPNIIFEFLLGKWLRGVMDADIYLALSYAWTIMVFFVLTAGFMEPLVTY